MNAHRYVLEASVHHVFTVNSRTFIIPAARHESNECARFSVHRASTTSSKQPRKHVEHKNTCAYYVHLCITIRCCAATLADLMRCAHLRFHVAVVVRAACIKRQTPRSLKCCRSRAQRWVIRAGHRSRVSLTVVCVLSCAISPWRYDAKCELCAMTFSV